MDGVLWLGKKGGVLWMGLTCIPNPQTESNTFYLSYFFFLKFLNIKFIALNFFANHNAYDCQIGVPLHEKSQHNPHQNSYLNYIPNPQTESNTFYLSYFFF
jgi:hypothetical protein